MPPIDRLYEVILYVEDMERMVEFYTDVFGFDVAEGAVEHGFVKLATGATSLCLHSGRDGPLGAYAPKIVFAVDDLEATAEHLETNGVTLGEERNPAPGIRVIDGRDPEGNTFSIEIDETPS